MGGSALVVERVSLVLVKKESSLARSVPPFSLAVTPMSNTCASRWVSWFGFSGRIAFCVAARAPGDGGLGAGFIA